jgi:hypothetical protein
MRLHPTTGLTNPLLKVSGKRAAENLADNPDIKERASYEIVG